MVTASPRKIILVDDDLISLMMLESILKQEGYEVTKASDGEQALEKIHEKTAQYFDALVTDYLMPNMNGLDLMTKVREIDTALSIIMITSDSERETLSASLRGGVLDFLEKPVARAQVCNAVVRAVAKTAEMREMQGAQKRLTTVESIQDRLAPALTDNAGKVLRCALRTRSFPIFEAGGDFLSVGNQRDGAVHLVLGDVSGHGLLEGFIAAYFQGMVKGMQALGATPDQIAQECNRFLLKDWMSGDTTGKALPASLSALFVDLDLDTGKLEVLNCGCPAVTLYEPGKPLRKLAPHGCPLGWFDDFMPGKDLLEVSADGCVVVWSDGLPDYAASLGVHPESLAAHILLAPEGQPLALLAEKPAPDDVMVSCLCWKAADAPVCGEAKNGEKRVEKSLPIFCEAVPGDIGEKVDALQEELNRNLVLALEGIAPDTVDVLCLCAREAVINAAAHGCGGRADLKADLLVEYHACPEPLVRVIVDDPGLGYQHRPPQEPQDLLTGEGHVSLGLTVIRSLAQSVRECRNGARLEMDFLLEGKRFEK